jgi:hypothetical protein
MNVTLYDIAHARTGDKGTLNTVSLIPYDERWYPVLQEVVTAQLVAEHLQERYPGGVVRYEMENLSTLIFVCQRLPGDTVTTSLYLDAHAKSLSSALLELEIEVENDPSLEAKS